MSASRTAHSRFAGSALDGQIKSAADLAALHLRWGALLKSRREASLSMDGMVLITSMAVQVRLPEVGAPHDEC